MEDSATTAIGYRVACNPGISFHTKIALTRVYTAASICCGIPGDRTVPGHCNSCICWTSAVPYATAMLRVVILDRGTSVYKQYVEITYTATLRSRVVTDYGISFYRTCYICTISIVVHASTVSIIFRILCSRISGDTSAKHHKFTFIPYTAAIVGCCGIACDTAIIHSQECAFFIKDSSPCLPLLMRDLSDLAATVTVCNEQGLLIHDDIFAICTGNGMTIQAKEYRSVDIHLPCIGKVDIIFQVIVPASPDFIQTAYARPVSSCGMVVRHIRIRSFLTTETVSMLRFCRWLFASFHSQFCCISFHIPCGVADCTPIPKSTAGLVCLACRITCARCTFNIHKSFLILSVDLPLVGQICACRHNCKCRCFTSFYRYSLRLCRDRWRNNLLFLCECCRIFRCDDFVDFAIRLEIRRIASRICKDDWISFCRYLLKIYAYTYLRAFRKSTRMDDTIAFLMVISRFSVCSICIVRDCDFSA